MAAEARADVVPGSFVVDGTVSVVTPGGSGTFLGGSFGAPQAPTGHGVIAATSGNAQLGTYPHVAGAVRTALSDGSGGFFIGGAFTSVGGLPRTGVAHIKSNGTVDSSWDAQVSGPVNALLLANDKLYIGGSFASVGGQSRLNAAAVDPSSATVQAWDPQPNGNVKALATSGSRLYLGGSFSKLGAANRAALGAVDATTGAVDGAWAADVTGDIATVYALGVLGTRLYAGGLFTTVAGQPRGGAVALDTTTAAVASNWNPISGGAAYALATTGGRVYLGGYFSSVSGTPRNNVAAVDPEDGALITAWHPVLTPDTSGPNGGSADNEPTVTTFTIAGSDVYLGLAASVDSRAMINGVEREGVARVDSATGALDTAWNPRPSAAVAAVAPSSDGSKVYLGGGFIAAGPPLVDTANVLRLNNDGSLDTDWHQKSNGAVDALAYSNGRILIGGRFSAIDGNPRHRLAALDSSTGSLTSWDPSAATASAGGISAIAVANGRVYVAAPHFGPVAIDPTTGTTVPGWSTDAIFSRVFSMAVAGTRVYIAGELDLGTGDRPGLFSVNAETGSFDSGWSPHFARSNPMLPFAVNAVVTSGSTLYVAGKFATVNGLTRENVAALNAEDGSTVSAWQASGFSGGADITSLAVAGNRVYALGATSSAALDKMTGALDATWDPPASFSPAYAQAPHVIGTSPDGHQVYIGGSFDSSGLNLTGPFVSVDGVAGGYMAVDETPPSISVVTPSEGQRFARGQVVVSSFSCTDSGGSGVASCDGPEAVDTSTTGAKTFTVNATDVAGNSTQKVVSYVVDPDPVGPGAGPSVAGDTPGPAATVSANQIKSVLATALTPKGKPAKITALVKSGMFRQIFRALTAGKATISWYQLPRGAKLAKKTRPVLVATGSYAFAAAGTATINIKLTGVGKRLLKRAKKLKLTARGSFAPIGREPVAATKTFTLKK